MFGNTDNALGDIERNQGLYVSLMIFIVCWHNFISVSVNDDT